MFCHGMNNNCVLENSNLCAMLTQESPSRHTIYDRIDAVATINFSTQFGAATIQERCLFQSGVYFVRRGYRLN